MKIVIVFKTNDTICSYIHCLYFVKCFAIDIYLFSQNQLSLHFF